MIRVSTIVRAFLFVMTRTKTRGRGFSTGIYPSKFDKIGRTSSFGEKFFSYDYSGNNGVGWKGDPNEFLLSESFPNIKEFWVWTTSYKEWLNIK